MILSVYSAIGSTAPLDPDACAQTQTQRSRAMAQDLGWPSLIKTTPDTSTMVMSARSAAGERVWAVGEEGPVLVSIDERGEPLLRPKLDLVVSPNGRFTAFLESGPRHAAPALFVRDLRKRATYRVRGSRARSLVFVDDRGTLLWQGSARNGYELYRYNVNRKAVVALGFAGGLGVSPPVASRNGRFVLLQYSPEPNAPAQMYRWSRNSGALTLVSRAQGATALWISGDGQRARISAPSRNLESGLRSGRGQQAYEWSARTGALAQASCDDKKN